MDFITHTISVINHGCARSSTRVVARYSKKTIKICKILEQFGFVNGYNVLVKRGKKGIRYTYVEIFLSFYKDRPVMFRIFRISSKGNRKYCNNLELHKRIAQDRTFYVVSTSYGWILLDECIRRGIGGELLFGVSY